MKGWKYEIKEQIKRKWWRCKDWRLQSTRKQVRCNRLKVKRTCKAQELNEQVEFETMKLQKQEVKVPKWKARGEEGKCKT